jgi:hypothetical protein
MGENGKSVATDWLNSSGEMGKVDEGRPFKSECQIWYLLKRLTWYGGESQVNNPISIAF